MNQSSAWQPTANVSALKARAKLLQHIRHFFEQRQVLEVETPLLSRCSVTDVHLSAFSTEFTHPTKPENQLLYLQTSPEFAMKRLLCAGSGCIYQISKAFRNEEAGQYHNPEFTLLEWYRVGFDHWQLLDEVDALLMHVLQTEPLEKLTYQNAFMSHCGFDPLSASIETVRQRALYFGFDEIANTETNIDVLLQLLCSEVVEKRIGKTRPAALIGFPRSQAALARVDSDDSRIARRFEVYYKGVELANGYHELDCPSEQTARFAQDNAHRTLLNLPQITPDPRLIDALSAGLPDCAGVALGVDRLLMLWTSLSHIDQGLAFPVDKA